MNDYEAVEILRQEAEWRKCAADPVYFLSNYGYMWTKEGGDPVRWDLWECQSDALTKFTQHRLVVILKTRQLGMSWTACGYALWGLMFKANFHVYFQSIGQKEVAEQVSRIRFIYANLPEFMQQRVALGGRGRKDNGSLIEFSNGSALHTVATTKRAGHGAAPSLYIIDEFARNEHDKMVWRAVKPAIGGKGQVIVISTANGIGNMYHSLWVGASTSANNMFPIFYPAASHPDYTPEFLAREKEDYSGDMVGYYEAYPSTPEEAFMSSARCPFSIERIQQHLDNIAKNKIQPEVGSLEYGKTDAEIEFRPHASGNFFIWKRPLTGKVKPDGTREPIHRYAVGVDVAEGLVGGDWSVATVIDDDTGEVVAMFRGKIAPENYAYQLKLLGKFYGNAFIAIEVNMGSDFIVDDLKTSYAWLYTRERRERIYDEPTLEVGFRTTGASKPRIITQMRRYFDSTEKPLRIYSPLILNEMAAFEEDERKRLGASGSEHDDTVMSLAIAIECSMFIPKINHDYAPKHHRLGSRSL